MGTDITNCSPNTNGSTAEWQNAFFPAWFMNSVLLHFSPVLCSCQGWFILNQSAWHLLNVFASGTAVDMLHLLFDMSSFCLFVQNKGFEKAMYYYTVRHHPDIQNYAKVWPWIVRAFNFCSAACNWANFGWNLQLKYIVKHFRANKVENNWWLQLHFLFIKWTIILNPS